MGEPRLPGAHESRRHTAGYSVVAVAGMVETVAINKSKNGEKRQIKTEENSMKKKKAISILILALSLCSLACAVTGAVWLVAAGYAEAALDAVIRWGEEGTLSAFEKVMMDRVIPMLSGFCVSAAGLYLSAKKMFKAIEKAKSNMDEATGEAVKTYEAHEAMNSRLETFMESERLAADAMRQAMKEEFDALAREQRESLAADRTAMKRIESKVDGMRSAARAAYGATGELVKNGTATRIAHIMEDTEGTEASPEQEGGAEDEVAGDDGQTA